MNKFYAPSLQSYDELFVFYYENTVVRLSKDKDGTFSVILQNYEAIEIDLNSDRNKKSQIGKTPNGLCCELFDSDGWNWDAYTDPRDAFNND